MASREFNALKRAIADLRIEFLNFKKRVDGKYTKPELMRCRAFIAFAHAEFEHYLESMALKILMRAEHAWDTGGKATTVIAGLLAYRNHNSHALPDDPRTQSSDSRLATLIKKSFKSQSEVIKRNNGIKPANLSAMFLPLGIHPDRFEAALAIQLKNFGLRRGGMVHAGSHVSLPNLRDPFDDELMDVNFLLTELESFDAILRASL